VNRPLFCAWKCFAFALLLVRVVHAEQPTPILPDSKMTPGDAFDVTAQDVCVAGYAKKVRHVPAQMKLEVYAEYAITMHGPGDYEVDHLIPLELGGSNSIKNLWPESHRTSPWKCLKKQGEYLSQEEAVQKGYRPRTLPENDNVC